MSIRIHFNMMFPPLANQTHQSYSICTSHRSFLPLRAGVALIFCSRQHNKWQRTPNKRGAVRRVDILQSIVYITSRNEHQTRGVWSYVQICACALVQEIFRSRNYSTFTLRRPVYKNLCAEFFTLMCESVESCDYQRNHRRSTCPLYAYEISERHDAEKKVCTQIKAVLQRVYTITSIIYSNVVVVECAEEDIRSYRHR